MFEQLSDVTSDWLLASHLRPSLSLLRSIARGKGLTMAGHWRTELGAESSDQLQEYLDRKPGYFYQGESEQ